MRISILRRSVSLSITTELYTIDKTSVWLLRAPITRSTWSVVPWIRACKEDINLASVLIVSSRSSDSLTIHDRLFLLLRPSCIYSAFQARHVVNTITYLVKIMRVLVWSPLACFVSLPTSAAPTTLTAVIAASAADPLSKSNVARGESQRGM